MPSIYKITNIINNKCYIGKTILDINIRFKRHLKNKSKTKLHNAIRKYGSENFNIICLEECLEIELSDKEVMYIEKYDTFKNGYNMTKGGDGGDTSSSPNYINSLITRDMSGSNNPMFGRSGELSSRYGVKLSNEHINRFSYSNKRKISCEGIIFNSIGEAEQHFKNISVRKRLNSEKYPNWYRIDPIIKRK